MTKSTLLTTAHLATMMGAALAGPSQGLFGPAPTLYADDDPTIAILGELKKIEDGISKKMDTRLEEMKAGFHLPTVDKKMQQLETEHEKLSAELKDAREQLKTLETKAGRLGLSGDGEMRTTGQQFVESQQFKSGKDAGGNIRIRMEMKALTGDAASVGSGVRAERLPYYQPPMEPHIRDLFAQGQTNSNALEFPQVKTWTNNAAVVADRPLKTATTSASYKPESDLVTELVTFPVRSIAHLIRAHKNILDDDAALRSLIDQKLLDGLKDVEDIELIKGDGTGNHVKGVLASASTFSRYTTGDTKLDVLRRATTDLRLKNFRADGLIINPLDWEDIELLKATDGKYIWVNVNDGGVPRLWRVPVIDSIAVDEGEFAAGAFKQGGQVFDRQAAVIEVFEQDRDNVPLNLITIRAEERLALVIYDQNAFVRGTYDDPTP
ncbi:phage major capsid protein [Deinococcus irradiatisoli]|uniref:Phage major capsid protein n=1 Tax=Deinococcus irradiatisoli TaxID=2202254 RepID=A0A2Z3JL56_9DEIO|nr:phage major capsid protein [Deinococcus irradiatisoli]AWN24010.1 phage major capsid protein [Deinococcus irradiatisoli]